jgi:hypothetical protein
MRQSLALTLVLGSFIYLVALMVAHPNWSRSSIAFFDAWYTWYPALVAMFVGLHLDGGFDPKS